MEVTSVPKKRMRLLLRDVALLTSTQEGRECATKQKAMVQVQFFGKLIKYKITTICDKRIIIVGGVGRRNGRSKIPWIGA